VHEFSIAQSVYQIAEQEARQHAGGRIRQVRCRVGVLQQVVPELLAESFDCIVDSSGHAGAELVIDKVPVEILCGDCGQRSTATEWRVDCPGCGSTEVQISGGDELELCELILEEADEDPGPA